MQFGPKDPHVFHVLMSLRQLSRGKVMLFGPVSCAIFLDGSPWIAHHAKWLLKMGAIVEIHSDHNVPSFKVTPMGVAAHRMLESWYGSLKLWQRLVIRYWGGHFPEYVAKYFPAFEHFLEAR